MRSQDEWALAPIGTATSVARRKGPSTRNHNAGRIAGTSIMAILATTLAPWAGSPAYALTPPAPPTNIVVFPDRDFLGLEGYVDRAGEDATITVRRAGTVTGSALGQINAAGDLEVNHPGGVCWGTNPAVVAGATPDIRHGDVVTANFADGTSDSVTTQGPAVTSFERPTLTPNRVVVLGTLGALGGPVANLDQLEQRIVEPALVTTDVGRRDVRATRGPLTRAATGGYSSSLEFSGNNFTATYVFDTASNAGIAAGGGMRVLTWMATDADANRQGLTIAEFGEAGGAGFGGCPTNAPGPTAPGTPGISTATAGNASAAVRWSRPIQGTSAITSYSIQVLHSNGTLAFTRTAPESGAVSSARAATVTGLTVGRDYHFQVQATNAAGSSGFSTPSNHVVPSTTPGAPVIRPSAHGAVGGAITATANWLPPVSNGGNAINGYVVTALRMNPGGPVLRRTNSVVQHFSKRTLSMTLPAGTYRFVVRARNGWGLGVATSAMSSMVVAR